MERLEIFKEELNYIKDSRVRNSLIHMINVLPDYFEKVG